MTVSRNDAPPIEAAAPGPPRKPAKFLSGDLMRHVAVMSLSASVGLVAVFLVDFVDLYFISLLGDASLTAAVGFAGTLIYFNMSATIGLLIAVSALASRFIGAGDEAAARRIATHVLAVGVAFAAVFGTAFAIWAPDLLDLIGAEGDAKARGASYLRIVAPSLPVVVVAMTASGLLRAHGDARRAMLATLAAGGVNAVLDPLLIFGLGLGLEGAAIASVCARMAMAAAALAPVLRHYGGLAPFNRAAFLGDLRPIAGIAGPAILTNIATPVGVILATRYIAPFGDDAVAGFAVVSRLTPLAFCVIFALSGAVGPIIGQNFGAGRFDRIGQTLTRALVFAAGCVALVWGILIAASGLIINIFGVSGDGVGVVAAFVWIGAPLFVFNGALFIANAAFNNLGRPTWSTGLNWARNTLGVLPFAMVGANIGGAPGVLVGQSVGGVLFAALGVALAYRLSARHPLRTPSDPAQGHAAAATTGPASSG